MSDTKWVRRLDDGYLSCRSLRHAWEIEFFGYLKDSALEVRTIFSSYSILRLAECARCGTRKVELFNREQATRLKAGEPFRKFYVRYLYPEGYVYREGLEERPNPQDYNRELFRRYLS